MEMALAKAKPKKKRSPHRPGYGGQVETEERTIVRPYEIGGTRETQTATVNVRETPLEHMYARGVITDGEKRAGEMFRRHCETIEMGGGVIDPARIKVDTSGPGDPMSDKAIDAGRKLAFAAQRIGHMDYALLHEVCAAGRSLVEVAKRWYMLGSARQARTAGGHIGRRVRDALAVLAKDWGTESGSDDKQKPNTLRSFGKMSLDPSQWNYSPEKAKADNKARRRRRRRKY